MHRIYLEEIYNHSLLRKNYFYRIIQIRGTTTCLQKPSFKFLNPYLIQMKKITAVLLLILVTATIAAQRVKRKGVQPIDVSKNKRPGSKKTPAFTMEQLVGKWQEIARTDKSNQPIDFTDTIYLNFTSTNKVTTREASSMTSMTGAASIEDPGNVLMAAADIYTILSVADSQLVLDNQENYLHLFKKTNQFFYETYGKLAVNPNVYKDPVSVSLADVKGRWMVYKKEAKPGTVNPPVNIIQYLKITDSTGENTATGEVTFYQTDQSTELPCTIKVTNAGIDITAGEYNWALFVYKADKKELVFGDAAVLLYYAKGY
jgi:hypothetical protein